MGINKLHLFGSEVRSRPPATKDRRVRRLPLLSGLAALGQYASRTARVPAARCAAFTATHGMADGIHGRSAIVRTTAHPSLSASFAEANIHVVGIADDTDGCPALGADTTDFTGWQRDLGPLALTSGQRGAGAGTAAKLTASSRLKLQIVHRHSQRNAAKRHAVADARLGIGSADKAIAGLQAIGSENVSFFAILILEQGDARGTVWIVFDRHDRSPNTVFLPLEINEAIHALVSASAKPRAGHSLIIAAAFLGMGAQQRFLGLFLGIRDFGKITD